MAAHARRRVKDQARVVIVGGGIAGCSIAYHLARKGWTDVLLLDKGELTSGSTWHAAGMVTHFHTSPTIMRMRQYSIRLYRSLQAEPGSAEHWHEVGSLRVASSRDQWLFLRRQVGTARALGLDVDTISPAEALRLFPLMSPDDLHGAMYLPGDGWIDPSGSTTELARRARALGVAVETGVRVTGIERSPDGAIAGVVTDRGRVRAEIVINAAGMWGRQVAAMAGISLPITPLVHQHLATKPIPGHELPRQTPCLRDPENLVYLREEVGGFLIGGFEREPVAWSVDGVPWDFTQRLLPSDWELFGEIMEGAIRRVPILGRAEMAHLTNGPEGITPDSRPLLGPVPGVPGFWAAAGLSHTGFGAGARDRRHHRGMARRGRAAVRRRRDERAALRSRLRGPRLRGRAGARVVPLLLHAALSARREPVGPRASPLARSTAAAWRWAACSARRTAGSA